MRILRRLNGRRAVWALVVLAPLTLPAAHATEPANSRTVATDFVHELAAGQFAQAEAHFDAQMREHATPAKLQNLWQYIEKKFGPYAKTEGSDSMRYHGKPMVIVHTMFKQQTVGLAVFFDQAHQITGLRVVPLQ